MKRTAIVGGKLVTPFRTISDIGLVMEGGKIVSFFKGEEIPGNCQILDAKGNYVSPGFIDMHVHGGGGHDFMDGTETAIIEAAKTHMRHGTTSIVPTTLTSTDEDLFNFLDVYRHAKEMLTDGPNLLGVHLEGPYFASSQRGAQDPRYLRVPTKKHYLEILNHSDDIVRMSVAPELDEEYALVAELKSRHILAAIGHSDAVYQQVAEAFERGYTHITHLYSGMSTLHRKNAFRYLGVVESAYLIDDMTVEIIADGKHLPIELLKLILKCKPMNKISLITDSSRGAGMADGQHVLLGSLKNGQDSVIEDGVAFTPDHLSFASSVCTSDRCVRTMYKLVGVRIEEAVSMMTINPARVLGIDATKGSLDLSKDADICIFNDNIELSHVIINGEIRWVAS